MEAHFIYQINQESMVWRKGPYLLACLLSAKMCQSDLLVFEKIMKFISFHNTYRSGIPCDQVRSQALSFFYSFLPAVQRSSAQGQVYHMVPIGYWINYHSFWAPATSHINLECAILRLSGNTVYTAGIISDVK